MRELMSRVTFTEFIEWLEYLKLVHRRNSKRDMYFAQIAAEVRRGYVKNPSKVKVDHFLLGEKTPGEEKSHNSKQTWAAALGITLN